MKTLHASVSVSNVQAVSNPKWVMDRLIEDLDKQIKRSLIVDSIKTTHEDFSTTYSVDVIVTTKDDFWKCVNEEARKLGYILSGI